MHVWLARCGRAKDCFRMTCHDTIKVSEAMVVGRYEGSQTYWHKECWIEDAEIMLSPYQAPKRGRHPLDISDEKKAIRNRILRAMASQRFTLKKLISEGRASITVKRIEIDLQILKLKLEEYGGVPSKWRQYLDGSN